jgi:hypothetical protein
MPLGKKQHFAAKKGRSLGSMEKPAANKDNNRKSWPLNRSLLFLLFLPFNPEG